MEPHPPTEIASVFPSPRCQETSCWWFPQIAPPSDGGPPQRRNYGDVHVACGGELMMLRMVCESLFFYGSQWLIMVKNSHLVLLDNFVKDEVIWGMFVLVLVVNSQCSRWFWLMGFGAKTHSNAFTRNVQKWHKYNPYMVFLFAVIVPDFMMNFIKFGCYMKIYTHIFMYSHDTQWNNPQFD